MSKKASIITIGVSVGLTLIALFVSLVVFITTTVTYKNQLENVYKRSFFELASNLNDIEIDISKLIATTKSDVQREILANINTTCVVAGMNISNLPVSTKNTKDIMAFVNKLNGFSYSLISKISTNTEWSEQDIKSIEDMHGHAVKLKYEFNNYTRKLDNNFTILRLVNFKKEDKNSLNDTFDNIQTTSSKVPTLIYDGPFAESVINPQIYGLPENEVTKEEARAVIEEKFTMYDIEEIEYKSETKGIFATFNFKVECDDDLDLFVQITKRGGKVLEITSAGSGGDKNLSMEECRELSKDFARSLGFDTVFPVWSMENGNIVYVNLAPVENGYTFYPDLIKVKLDKKIGVITGWEAKNYFYNYRDRTITTPKISIDYAESLLSPILIVKEKNKAVIPLQYGQEKTAYEYVCTWKNYLYYIYLDVVTGEELNVLRLISTTTGNKIM